MKFFYIATEPNEKGKFEIHERDCSEIPDMMIRSYLGPFNNGKEAFRMASIKNPDAVICELCCTPTHKPLIINRKDSSSSHF